MAIFMIINLLMALEIILILMFVLYWYLVFELIDTILERPKLTKLHRILVGGINTGIILTLSYFGGNFTSLYTIYFIILIVNLSLFYSSSWGDRLFCASACIIHIMALVSIVISIFSIFYNASLYELSMEQNTLVITIIVAFGIINLAVISVLKFIPKDKLRILNQHKEQQWFLIAWMTVFNIYLIYNAEVFSRPIGHHLAANTLIAPLAILFGLYIVLFFAFKTSMLLGYKEKSAKLEQTIIQEQQYRNAATKDALKTYEVNFTKDIVINGLEEKEKQFNNISHCYSELLLSLSHYLIYSEDNEKFINFCMPSNILKQFDSGESEVSIDYRRLLDNDGYKWVKATANLVKEHESGDIIGFISIRDIDKEKKYQLSLQYKAERDPLTELYNKEFTQKLINEQLNVNNKNLSAALLMIDIDNFKDVNDNFGHVFGDAVLCDLSDKLQNIFRGNDILGRIGGDEFIAFINGKNIQTVIREKAEEICKAFHSVYRKDTGEEYIISSSIGIAMCPENGMTFEDLYNNADIALYDSKDKGKNTYSFYDGSDFKGYQAVRTQFQQSGTISQKNFKQNRIEYVFKILYQSDNPVMAIHAILELVARHFFFERGYIFETSQDGLTTSNTFEWCADGIEPQIDVLQNLPIEVVATANSNFHKSGTFILKSIKNLSKLEKDVLEPQGIKSMFQFGIFDKDNLLGFIGFDNCNNEKTPTDTEIDEMRTICNILATFFVKQYIVETSAKTLASLKEVMNNLENYIYVVNKNTLKVIFMNEKTSTLMSGEQPLDEYCYCFFRGNTEQCPDCPIRNIDHESCRESSMEMYNKKLDIWVKATASALDWMDGSIACLINCIDITEQKNKHLEHIAELEKIAYYDELTSCRNYYKFIEDAQRVLKENKDKTFMMIKLDIDNFRMINQVYGYEKGDEILCKVAKALEMTVESENEIIARRGNDEFVILVESQNDCKVGRRYNAFLKNVKELVGENFIFKFTFPHGRYFITPGEIEETSIMEMFERVNIAHKTAKLDKSTPYVLYNESLSKRDLHRKEIENKMEGALINNEFLVYLQPKYYLDTEKIGGAEALVRWKYEDRIMFPGEFISIFEQNGFIVKIDFYVLRQVCGIIKGWLDDGIEPITVSVNFSRIHLGNENLVKQLCEIVDSFKIDRKYIEIEVTESAIYENIEDLIDLLDDLHIAGFTMSMDDFGSGYSSLGMLQNLKVDVIKLDRSFFINQKDEKRSKTVVGSVIEMASSLGIKIVAEGVEEKEHIELLKELLCDMAQGYYFKKPIEVENFRKLLEVQRDGGE